MVYSRQCPFWQKWQTTCIVFYHGMLLSHCSQEMKELVLSEDDCRWKVLMNAFGYSCQELRPKHSCCDNCVKSAVRVWIVLPVVFQYKRIILLCVQLFVKRQVRPVTDKNRMALKAKIKQYHDLISWTCKSYVKYSFYHIYCN